MTDYDPVSVKRYCLIPFFQIESRYDQSSFQHSFVRFLVKMCLFVLLHINAFCADLIQRPALLEMVIGRVRLSLISLCVKKALS